MWHGLQSPGDNDWDRTPSKAFIWSAAWKSRSCWIKLQRAMCSNGKLFCLVLRRAAAQLYERVYLHPSAGVCSGAVPWPPALSPPHTSQALASCSRCFPPSSGYQQLKSQEKKESQEERHPSPSLAGWVLPAVSSAAFLSVELTLSSLQQQSSTCTCLNLPSLPAHPLLYRSDLSVPLPHLLQDYWLWKTQLVFLVKEKWTRTCLFYKIFTLYKRG